MIRPRLGCRLLHCTLAWFCAWSGNVTAAWIIRLEGSARGFACIFRVLLSKESKDDGDMGNQH